MIKTPDLDAAAIKAMEILRDHRISETPVNPIDFLSEYKNVRVMPFTKMAQIAGVERKDLVPMFGSNQDAALFHMAMAGMDTVEYVIVYNMRLPIEIIYRGIARELGHVALGHDGQTRHPEARMAEALTFAHHLLCPRPIIHIIRESGIPMTMDVFTETMGCSDVCVSDMQTIPGVRVPAELNREVRDLFAPHILEYIRFHRSSPMKDRSAVLDLGTYMDLYEE